MDISKKYYSIGKLQTFEYKKLYLKDAVYYNGSFYASKDQLDNFDMDGPALSQWALPVLPLDHHTLPKHIDPAKLPYLTLNNKNVPVVNQHLHDAILHNLWDAMYGSWYNIFHSLREKSFDDYIPVSIAASNPKWGVGRNHQIISQFSGSIVRNRHTFKQCFSGEAVKIEYLFPVIAPANANVSCAIAGSNDVLYPKYQAGMGRGFLEAGAEDPVDIFIERMFKRYNINRNRSVVDLNKILYIKNKRPFHGIENLFSKLNEKYKNKFIFEIIDYNDYLMPLHIDENLFPIGSNSTSWIRNGIPMTNDFGKQLNLINQARVIIAGSGTARCRNFFMPHGGIEICLHEHVHGNNTLQLREDCKFSSISKYIKMIDVLGYSEQENLTKSIPSNLEKLIDDALLSQPFSTPINIEDNFHPYVRKAWKDVDNLNTKYSHLDLNIATPLAVTCE